MRLSAATAILFSVYVINTLAWAPPARAQAPDCSREAGSLPDPSRPAGVPDPAIPVENIIVILQENRSFDSYFGRLNDPAFYGSEVDGITEDMWNPDASGAAVHAFHQTSICPADADHSWNGSHGSWNGGLNDGFVRRNGEQVMGYFEEAEIPFYYALANEFAIGDRYFSSVLAPTTPNRAFMFTASAFGLIQNDSPKQGFAQKTIFETLDEHGISWKYYQSAFGDYLKDYKTFYKRDRAKVQSSKYFKKDLAGGRLPQVSFVDASGLLVDEHPVADVHIGQAWVARRVRALMGSRYWAHAVLFFAYDEAGGLYDHVPPPEACVPDEIPPHLKPDSISAAYDHYGYRVPLVAISPYARRHFVSHAVYDHTSILKFIETKYNLPALTRRDANADAMLGLFDFEHPRTEVPALPKAKLEVGLLLKCLGGHLGDYLQMLLEVISGGD